MEFIEESVLAEIISKSLFGTLTHEEERKLREWIARSDQNRILYEKIAGGSSFREQEEIGKLFARNRGSEKIGRKIRARYLRRISVAALSVASVIAAAVIILKTPGGESGFPEAANLEMREAGKPHAVLTYENTSIALTEKEQGSEWCKYVSANDGADNTQISIAIPRGGEYRLELPDGTVVWLNSQSRMEYPKEFQDTERVVRLEGEAFFEVAHDASKPFYVEFGDARVRVLGTSFNISAYADDEETTATLLEGKIEISRGGQTEQLTPDRQAVIRKDRSGIVVNEVDASLYSSWTQGVFRFENMRLEEICAKLSRWYDVDFEFEGGSGDERFTGGTWKYLPLGEFLSGIEKVTDIRFDYTGNKVRTTGKI